MSVYMPDGVMVTRDGPSVDWTERNGVRSISITLRVGELGVTISLSTTEAAKLAERLIEATR